LGDKRFVETAILRIFEFVLVAVIALPAIIAIAHAVRLLERSDRPEPVAAPSMTNEFADFPYSLGRLYAALDYPDRVGPASGRKDRIHAGFSSIR
jgi:hypothetical protein